MHPRNPFISSAHQLQIENVSKFWLFPSGRSWDEEIISLSNIDLKFHVSFKAAKVLVRDKLIIIFIRAISYGLYDISLTFYKVYIQWSRTLTVHLIWLTYFRYHINNFQFDVTIQSPRTLNDPNGHLKCEDWLVEGDKGIKIWWTWSVHLYQSEP